MDRYTDNKPNLTAPPKDREEIIMDAFEEAYCDAETYSINPASFSIKLNETMVRMINQCETPDDYEELEQQLKKEILNFTSEFAIEPWDSTSSEPGVDKFVLPALEYLDEPGDFVKSEEFQDAVVDYVSATAPYSAEKTRSAAGLTPVDLKQKIIEKAFTVKTDIETEKWNSPYSQKFPDQREHGVMVVAAISEMYPDNEELRTAALDLTKKHFQTSVENYVESHIEAILPDWDETAIVGFDLHKMMLHKIKGEKEGVIEFADYNEAEYFLSKKMSEFIANYLTTNGERLVEEFISENKSLKDYADRTGKDLESYFLASIADNLSDYFDDQNGDRLLVLLHRLYDLVNEEYVRKYDEIRNKKERILRKIADDYTPEIDRSGWDYDKST